MCFRAVEATPGLHLVTSPASLDPLELIRQRAAENGDSSYGDFVSSRPYSYYQHRVDELGFQAIGRVLDVGCGFGHWTAALSEINDEVVGVDRSAQRLAIAAEVANSLSLDNVVLELADVQELPFPDGRFQGVFCHDTLQYLDRDTALAEFNRVLEPGGRLYVCTPATGWWLRLWIEALRSGNGQLRKSAFRGWAYGWRSSSPNAVGMRRAKRLLRGRWTNVEATHEGLLGVEPGEAKPLYPGSWHGLESVIEFTAEKAGAPKATQSLQSARESGRALEAARTTLRRTTYEYTSPLELHRQPRPVVDLVNTCDAPRVRRATARGRRADRLDVLRALFTEAVAGKETEEGRILACVTFAQLHFFHHFAGQPMRDGTPVQDPVASVLLGSGRCGTTARFLVDLFECNGRAARLVGGGCHTWAEVEVSDRWVIADANLYPPGIMARTDVGTLLSFDEAVARPDLLNRVPSYVNYHYEFVDAFLRAYPETRTELEPLLRRPLLPSSGYFGGEFFLSSNRPVGAVQRHSKVGTPEEWAGDEEFGWGSLEVEETRVPGLPVEHRPPQVSELSTDGAFLVWSPVEADPGEDIQYRVVASVRSRGWEYNRLPVGCTFEFGGREVHTSESRISVRELGEVGFATIVAQNAAWAGREIFYLPSREFQLDATAAS